MKGEGDLKNSSSSGLIAVSQREGGFQESASSDPSNVPHPSDRHFYICLKEDVKPENRLFLAFSQGVSLVNLYLLELCYGNREGK